MQYKSRRKVKVFIPDYIFLMEIQLYSNYFLNKKSKLDITFLEPTGTIKSIKYNKEITFPYNYSAENLYRKDQKYDLL